MTTKKSDIYKQLSTPFPKEALSVDNSRGFALTSVKAQYVVERLNEALGVENWTHGGTYEAVEGGVIFKGVLTASIDGVVTTREAVGFGKTSRVVGDMYKSAKTDSLSKCASQLGVANEVFKGLVVPPSTEKKAQPVRTQDDF